MADAAPGAGAGPARPGPGGRAVLVLGMGRSGTSLTMRVLNLLGVHLGPEEELLEASPHDNPTGYWENRGIMQLNDEVLVACGATWWFDPPPLEPGWERAPALEPLRERARALLCERFAGRALWGFKDPRLSLTLPFWRGLLPDVCCVVCVRHPLGVARSLQRRDPGVHPVADAVRAWARYTASALANTRAERRLILAYEGWAADPAGQVAALSRFIGAGEAGAGCERVAGFVRPELLHGGGEDADALPLAPRVMHACLDAAARRAREGGGDWPLDGRLEDLLVELGTERVAPSPSGREEVTLLEAELARALREREAAAAELARAYASRSWRITRPLRAAGERLRRR